MNRYLCCLVFVLLITPNVVQASADLDELETTIQQELEKKSFNHRAYLEIQDGLLRCKDQVTITSGTEIGSTYKAISFSCRTHDSEILVSESLVHTDKEGNKTIESYQEIRFVEKILTPQAYLKLLDNFDKEIVSTKDEATPGLRTLGTFARVGIPVALAIRASKVVAPNRGDWQRHFIAGSLISGVTILGTRGITRFIARKRGVQFSERKVALISSMAGLMVSLIVGGGKEIYDRTGRGSPEFRDAFFTAAGGAFVSLFNLPWSSYLGRRFTPIP